MVAYSKFSADQKKKKKFEFSLYMCISLVFIKRALKSSVEKQKAKLKVPHATKSLLNTSSFLKVYIFKGHHTTF